MSPTMISEYRTKLISKETLQWKLVELTEMTVIMMSPCYFCTFKST